MNVGTTALLAVVALAAAVSLGCGGSSTKKSGGDENTGKTSTTAASAGHTSCSVISAIGTCSEYAREDAMGLSKGLCEGFKGTYAQTPCPNDGVVGTCTLPNEEWKKYYVTKDPSASFSVDDAKKDCESDLLKGKFTPSANPPKKPDPPASAASGSGGAGNMAGNSLPLGKGPAASASASTKKH